MKHRPSTVLTTLALLGTLSLVGPILRADAPQTGTLEGVVLDASGGLLPGVTVTLESPRGEQTTQTDAAGAFRFGLLPPGDYSVAATLEGFAPSAVAVVVETGARKKVELRLGLDVSETIEVIAEAPLVDKFEVGTGATLDAAAASEMVFTNRISTSLVTALPGIVQDDVSQQLGDSRPAMNGGLWQENAAFIDGVDTSNTRRGGGSRIALPVTALAEVGTDGAGYGADIGRALGGVTSLVTKSGTNRFHGDFLWVAQSQKWTAQSDNIPLPREDDLINSYELSLGGPIVQDKAWFFVSAADNTSNELTALASGELLDNSLETEARIAKLNFAPGTAHQIAGTYIDAPGDIPFFNPVFYEILAVSDHALGGDFLTLNWNWAMASDKFLEVRFASQDSDEGRVPIRLADVDPNANPDSPPGNQGAYWDLATTFRYHASGLPLGPGVLNFPRDQANVAFNWFVDAHELRFGIDAQDVSWETVNLAPDRYLGRFYNESLPGGFQVPVIKRVFLPVEAPVETSSQIYALFAQDRLTVGDKWLFTFGLRYDDQTHDNDVGQTVVESSDLAPRLALTYDVSADGTFLVKATAGRYYNFMPQDLVNDYFTTANNGANSYDQYGWNPATQRYDRFQQRVLPSASNTRTDGIDPYYKDELTLGFDWQFTEAWAFTARGIYWTLDDIFTATDQFDPDGSIYVQVDNLPEAERKYLGLQLQLNRRFRNNWVLRSNYTLAKAEGNVFGNSHFLTIDDDFLEGRAILDPVLGIPVTAVNRYGPAPQDRTHVLNISGAKNWTLGEHTFTLGGLFWFRSGAPWNLTDAVTLALVPGGPTITSTRFLEPRGSRELDSIFNLNLAASWEFPLYKDLHGTLRLEAANVTDEQEQIAVNTRTGRPIPVRSSWQKPRELRAIVGLRF